MRPFVRSIFVYPVKSAAGLALEAAAVERRGLALDRRWMVVDARGRFVSAREQPALVRVRAVPAADTLALSAPGMPTLQVPVDDRAGDVDVEVWGQRVTARACGAAADAWFSRHLAAECRLVRMGDDDHRAVDPRYARDGDEVSFADGFPLLLVAEGSLADLDGRAPIDVSVRRFRPNLFIGGSAPYAEDGWQRLRIAGVEFDVPKPCDRCVLTTVDPDTGLRHPEQEPLRTLAGYRRDRGRGILFGVNLIPRGSGTVRTGDAVEVLR